MYNQVYAFTFVICIVVCGYIGKATYTTIRLILYVTLNGLLYSRILLFRTGVYYIPR